MLQLLIFTPVTIPRFIPPVKGPLIAVILTTFIRFWWRKRVACYISNLLKKSSVVYMKHKEHHCKKSILLQNWCTIHFHWFNFSKLILISITEGIHCIEMGDFQLWMLTYDIHVHSSFLHMKLKDYSRKSMESYICMVPVGHIELQRFSVNYDFDQTEIIPRTSPVLPFWKHKFVFILC